MKKKDTSTVDKAHELKDMLKAAGIRVNVDDSNQKPGDKYYYWEVSSFLPPPPPPSAFLFLPSFPSPHTSPQQMKGVPLRIEIGPRDLGNGVITCVPRHSGVKKTISSEDDKVVSLVQEELASLEKDMKKIATDFHEVNISPTMTQTTHTNAFPDSLSSPTHPHNNSLMSRLV